MPLPFAPSSTKRTWLKVSDSALAPVRVKSSEPSVAMLTADPKVGVSRTASQVRCLMTDSVRVSVVGAPCVATANRVPFALCQEPSMKATVRVPEV